MPALARRKTLPQSYWIYGDLTDPRTREVFLRREILNDLDALPEGASAEVRHNAELAKVEAVAQYAGFVDLATLPERRPDDDPWQRVTEIARRIPLWHQPRPAWPKGS